jgi:hypothetical protein
VSKDFPRTFLLPFIPEDLQPLRVTYEPTTSTGSLMARGFAPWRLLVGLWPTGGERIQSGTFGRCRPEAGQYMDTGHSPAPSVPTAEQQFRNSAAKRHTS